jgi:hypothetical protein
MPTQKRKGGKKVRGGSNGTSSVSTSSSSTKGTRTKSPKAKRATSKYNTVQSDEEDEEPSQTKARGGKQTRTATPRSESDSDDPKEQPSDESEDDDDEEGDDVSKDDDVSCHSGSKTAKRVYSTYQVATTNNTQLNLQRTDSERPRSSRPTPPKPQPNTVWKDIDENMKQVKVEKTAVHDFVSNYLFPKLKFVRGSGVNMDYSTEPRSICSLVMAGCHQIHSSEGMVWWGFARKQTVNEIKRLRNDASKTLKRAFLGKNHNIQEDTLILIETLT